ncbi:MAG TPA: AAA family ATPase [Pseudonocardia sp.]|nr:AAA family ATPase [Pseudonocardia sp.]
MREVVGRTRPVVVGRAAERAVLERALTRCTQTGGGFGCVVLVGDPGAGKSRLAAAFAADHADGVTVLSARAHQVGATSSFGVWAEALDRELRTRTPGRVRELCAGVEDDLAAVVRSVARLRDTEAAPAPRARVLDALGALVRALAAERPVVVVLDDLHLADASSLSALLHLAFGCAEERVLVVATARPAELADRADAVEVLLRLEQEGWARRLAVGPLDADGVRALAAQVLDSTPPEPRVDWLVERARVKPLDTVDLLGGLLDEGADLRRPALSRLPDPLADRVALRVGRTDPAAVGLVELLAVIGGRAELRSLVALSGRPPAELVDLVERLGRARLVTEREDGPELTVEIAHPLVAEAVYTRIGVARRRLLHREVARVLRALGRPGEAAGHFARSAGPGDDEAVTALREAVHAAEEAGAFQEALSLLAALVDLLPAGDPRWAGVVDALRWDAQWVVDHRADGHAALGVPALRAMDAALSGLDDPARQAPVKLRLANFIGWGEGTLDEAASVCRDAVALYERAGDRRGALLAAHELSWLRGYAGDLPLLESEAAAVAAEAERLGDDLVHARALRTAGLMALLRGRLADAEAAFRGVAAAAGTDRYRQLLAAGGLAVTAVMAGRTEDALAALADIRLPRTGTPDHATIIAWWAGDLHTIRAITRDIAGIGPTPASRRLGVGLFYAALAAVEVGANAEARRYAARLRALYDGRGWAMHAAMAEHVEGVADWRDGRAAEAIGRLTGAVAPLLRGDFVAQAVPLLTDLAEVAGSSGTPDRDAAAELRRIADRTGLAGFRGLADLAAGWASGDRRDAQGLAERAAGALTPWPLLRGRALRLLARSTDDRDRRVAALTAAADLFAGCGATVRRAEVLDELASLGSRGRRAAAAARGPESLTAREREVAELAAAGRSAREIAAALFVGERTVEGHLARVYARLGVRSKVELARRAGEFGLRTGTRTGARTATPDGPPAAP